MKRKRFSISHEHGVDFVPTIDRYPDWVLNIEGEFDDMKNIDDEFRYREERLHGIINTLKIPISYSEIIEKHGDLMEELNRKAGEAIYQALKRAKAAPKRDVEVAIRDLKIAVSLTLNMVAGRYFLSDGREISEDCEELFIDFENEYAKWLVMDHFPEFIKVASELDMLKGVDRNGRRAAIALLLYLRKRLCDEGLLEHLSKGMARKNPGNKSADDFALYLCDLYEKLTGIIPTYSKDSDGKVCGNLYNFIEQAVRPLAITREPSNRLDSLVVKAHDRWHQKLQK